SEKAMWPTCQATWLTLPGGSRNHSAIGVWSRRPMVYLRAKTICSIASWSRFTDSPRCVSLRRLLFLQVFVEADAVAERVDDPDAPAVVERRLAPRTQVLVALAGDLPVDLLDARHPDEDRRAGAAVAVMLAQVQYQPAPGHLHVGRGVLLEVVFPIDGEAEE